MFNLFNFNKQCIFTLLFSNTNLHTGSRSRAMQSKNEDQTNVHPKLPEYKLVSPQPLETLLRPPNQKLHHQLLNTIAIAVKRAQSWLSSSIIFFFNTCQINNFYRTNLASDSPLSLLFPCFIFNVFWKHPAPS